VQSAGSIRRPIQILCSRVAQVDGFGIDD
jgi:hypothetical protein